MKKFALFLAPLLAISFLVNCGGQSGQKQYTVTFNSNGGSGVPSQKVEANKCAVKPADPSKDTAEATYTFVCWELNNIEFNFDTQITEDITLIAKWNKGPTKKYTITWKNDDGSTLRTDSVEYGKTPDYGLKNPTKPSTDIYDYKFDGWSPKIVPVTGDATYTAQYKSSFRKYTLTVVSEDESKGTVTGGGIIANGTSVTITATPSTGYEFEGWYLDDSKVSSSASYTFTMPANDINYVAKFYIETGPWYQRHDWWNYCSNGVVGEQAVAEDIGKEVDLTVNNQIHKVRLIDVEHDELYNASGKAHCTFEFSNLLSDSNGYSLATLWNTKDGRSSTNYDYPNSDLRKALDGQGSGTLRWYQKESGTKSVTYTTSVYDMLPDALKNNIKTVKKQIATSYSYDINNYNAKVFALTYREMTQTSSEDAKEEGTIYKYYKDHDNNSSRMKHQIKWHEGAVTTYTEIADLNWYPHNYAGYNSLTEAYGGHYWIASPDTGHSDYAWYVGGGGYLKYYYDVYYNAFAVAPAFCI